MLSVSFVCLGPVTEVKTDIYVTSFGPVSDVEMVRTNSLNAVKHMSMYAFVVFSQVEYKMFYFQMTPDNREAVSPHLQNLLRLFFLSFVNVPVSGVHNGRVLSADVGGPEVDVRGPDRDPEAEQPDGDQSVDAGHLLQERQEVGRSQHDGPQQAFPHHEERHHSVHHEVYCTDY